MSAMTPGDVRVVILAGGRGTRLRPLTTVFPKPLVPLGDKPILEILLRRLSNLGFKNATLCTGYLHELIMAVVGDGSQYGLCVEYSYEEGQLGTAAPLAAVERLTDPFVVMNGDLLTTLDFRNQLRFHTDTGADITIGVFRRDVKIDLGVVESDEQGRFCDFREKPTYHFEVSMGVNVLNLSVLRFIERGKYLDMPDLILRVHKAGGRVYCYREDCFWLDIGRMEDYAIAQEHYERNAATFLGNLQ
ncbi:MAG: sugar phosphate nucleotidyltransferase [Kiritimatiellia bacterium]